MSDRDKRLTKAMGACWHEDADPKATLPVCKHCGQRRHTTSWFNRGDFSTWEGMGRLLPFAKDQDTWCDFAVWLTLTGRAKVNEHGGVWLCDMIIDPDRFATAYDEYLQGKG